MRFCKIFHELPHQGHHSVASDTHDFPGRTAGQQHKQEKAAQFPFDDVDKGFNLILG